jgi:hypothetical protein
MKNKNEGYALNLVTLAAIEAVYQVSLSEDERRLLTAAPLGDLEGQRQYLLRRALDPCRCPACQSIICIYSAASGGYDATGARYDNDNDYACPFCKALLHYWLNLTGQQGFDLQPGQTITTGKQA